MEFKTVDELAAHLIANGVNPVQAVTTAQETFAKNKAVTDEEWSVKGWFKRAARKLTSSSCDVLIGNLIVEYSQSNAPAEKAEIMHFIKHLEEGFYKSKVEPIVVKLRGWTIDVSGKVMNGLYFTGEHVNKSTQTSFLKELGSLVGQVTGDIVGGTVKLVGDITGSDLIEDIGESVQKASYFAGDKLGKAASGTWDVAAGIIMQDERQLNAGFSDLGSAIGDTVKATGHTVVNVVENSSNVIDGIANGNTNQMKDGALGLVKFGVVGALAFGVFDLVDGVDLLNSDSITVTDDLSTSEDVLIDNQNTHHVEPHERTLTSGETIWVDGDGDSSVNTYEGWNQTNPDYREKA
ncbi:hypothetical protein [Lysinibacillus piscis]|uniref:WXG100 family type VII secretion target n=1 Tax=Lysinibacillus piscis TaxID=2518931 RepID=A0ABQ5NQK5_9BACI|nr:hypothetical protein [Lysinibacillus sp. KH24]GLC90578.1 hypothetical protein LYSBPC_37050 [Lysinibacillus sp. KH24]